IDLGALHRELEDVEPSGFLPAGPLRTVVSRHTVGLTDPLTDADIAPAERVDDGLPQSLDACVRTVGLTHCKIKRWGDDCGDRDLSSGYAGTSHKNCKGVFKSIANAGLIARRRRQDPSARFVVSGEDLSNIGPVALLQDTAVVATLGITHAERNGHHYFKGL